MTETINRLKPFQGSPPVTSYFRFWIILVVVLFADQLSKWVIVSLSGYELGHYPPFGGAVIIPGFFNLVYAVNLGAAWGMLEGFSWLLIVLAMVFLTLIFVFRKDLQLHIPMHQICFSMVSGGIIGNTMDRLFRGHVVDFLDFHLPWYRWPTFNVADSAIVVGTLWYIYLQFRTTKQNQS